MTGRSTMVANALRQTAVYWGTPVATGIGGKSFADPVEVDVRWQDASELFIDAAGQEVTSSAIVYSATDMDVGGYLGETTLAALSSAEEGDPQNVSGMREIRRVGKTTNLAGGIVLYKVWL